MASAETDQPEPLLAVVFAREAVGSAVLCAGVLACSRWLRADAQITTVLIVAGVTAAIACVAVATCSRVTGTLLVPNGALARASHGPLSPDDAATVILVQLAGAAVAGLLVGAIDHQPLTAMPGIRSFDNLRELIAACGLGVAARVLSRDRESSPLWMALLVAVAVVAGVRFLGMPTVLIGDALAGLPDANVVAIGGVLGAQALGIVLAMACPLPALSGSVATSPDRAA